MSYPMGTLMSLVAYSGTQDSHLITGTKDPPEDRVEVNPYVNKYLKQTYDDWLRNNGFYNKFPMLQYPKPKVDKNDYKQHIKKLYEEQANLHYWRQHNIIKYTDREYTLEEHLDRPFECFAKVFLSYEEYIKLKDNDREQRIIELFKEKISMGELTTQLVLSRQIHDKLPPLVLEKVRAALKN